MPVAASALPDWPLLEIWRFPAIWKIKCVRNCLLQLASRLFLFLFEARVPNMPAALRRALLLGMAADDALPLGFRAGVIGDSWRRCLREWALALLEELRATEDGERRRAASLLIPVFSLARVVAEEAVALHAEVGALVRAGDDGWRAVPHEARRLPPIELTTDLVAASDPARVIAARVTTFARLMPFLASTCTR